MVVVPIYDVNHVRSWGEVHREYYIVTNKETGFEVTGKEHIEKEEAEKERENLYEKYIKNGG